VRPIVWQAGLKARLYACCFHVVCVASILSLGVSGQTPVFDVASVKRSPDALFGFPGVMLQPGGRVTSPGTTVRQLILVAYGLQDLQLVGGPSWLGNDLYAIDARTVAGATRANVRLMLRALLAERFQLTAHLERRELPVLALVLANRDGRLGPRLHRSGPECAPVKAPEGVPLPPPPPPGPGPGFTALLPQDPLGPTCGFVSFPGWMSGRRITMAHFVGPLTEVTRRIVADETGLVGEFDVDVTFMPDQPVALNGAAAPPSLAMSDRPSLMTAIQEDLGLKLEPQRREVDVLVIDRIERPSEN
jgi:uncharacterized protein (TIGR03435 family)